MAMLTLLTRFRRSPHRRRTRPDDRETPYDLRNAINAWRRTRTGKPTP